MIAKARAVRTNVRVDGVFLIAWLRKMRRMVVEGEDNGVEHADDDGDEEKESMSSFERCNIETQKLSSMHTPFALPLCALSLSLSLLGRTLLFWKSASAKAHFSRLKCN